jgi:hypothetical protein
MYFFLACSEHLPFSCEFLMGFSTTVEAGRLSAFLLSFFSKDFVFLCTGILAAWPL